jgi:hypothetical protein
MAIQLTIIFDRRMIPRLVRGVAQPGSATALGAVGREFESLHPDHIYFFAPVAHLDRASAFKRTCF